MAEPLARKTAYDREEYLAMEAVAEFKSEYYQGEIFAMTGGTAKHSLICVNLTHDLWEAVRNKPCLTFESNMKLDLAEVDAYVYPDIMVVCGPPEMSKYTTDAITNPILIVEVLSPGTESFDRGRKFEYYRTLPSLKEYVLVSQDRPRVEVYFRQSDITWQYTVVEGLDRSVMLHSLEHEISLSDIYHKIDMAHGT